MIKSLLILAVSLLFIRAASAQDTNTPASTPDTNAAASATDTNSPASTTDTNAATSTTDTNAAASASSTNAADSTSGPPPLDFASLHPTVDTWQGFKRYSFTVDGCSCWVAVPKDPIPGNHWAWWMQFPEAFPDRTGEGALLSRGYYVAYMNVGNTYGAPSALAHLSAFYLAMHAQGLRSKATLVAVSRGGLFAYDWAGENLDKVSVIYGDAPVCDYASWPYAQGKGADSEDWKLLKAAYGFKSDQEAIDYAYQPMNELPKIAAARIALVNVVGDADTTVPPAENTAVLADAYKKMGGTIMVIHKPGCEHHPHGLADPTPVVDFIVSHNG